jgi:hypothetical protein
MTRCFKARWLHGSCFGSHSFDARIGFPQSKPVIVGSLSNSYGLKSLYFGWFHSHSILVLRNGNGEIIHNDHEQWSNFLIPRP